MNQGLLYVFTGDGKGKTSAALGTAMRAVGNGMKVAWIAFYKQASWKLSEVETMKKIGIDVYLMGKGFNLKGKKTASLSSGGIVVDTASRDEHKKAAVEALEKARQIMGFVDVLVLDEINNAMSEGLVESDTVLQVLDQRGATHVILTGRNVPEKIMTKADLVTEMKKVKHPYDTGKLAMKGLDF